MTAWNISPVLVFPFLLGALCGCDASIAEVDAGTDAGSDLVDGRARSDAGANEPEPSDSGARPDVDAGASAADAGQPRLTDGGRRPDAGGPDAGGPDAGTIAEDGGTSAADAGPLRFTVVTFNTGTGTTNGVEDDGDAWTSVEQGRGRALRQRPCMARSH